ncbi:MAG: FAD-binding protein [Candidatus Binatia bacterium]
MLNDRRTWDQETDLLVVGSGAAGMTAALVARLEGLDSLVLEKTGHFGGSTAISGGGIWIPNNHLMEQAGIPDSFENACRYMQNTVGDRTPRKNQEAFVVNAHQMLKYLAGRASLKFRIADGFPDYYPERPGGVTTGRTVFVPLFAGRKLGRQFASLRDYKHEAAKSIPVTLQEFKRFLLCKTNPAFLLTAARVGLRAALGRVFGRRYVGMGRALAASLLRSLHEHAVPMWLQAGLRELVMDGACVTGVLAEKEGRVIATRARKGVVLAAGGFAHNAAMRDRFLPKPASTDWTSAAKGDTGEVIRAAMMIGAAVDLMDDAWWGATLVKPGEAPVFMLMERSYPGSIIVNSAGKRFVNEATSYIDIGHSIYENNGKGGVTIPAHLVIDHRFRSNYLLGLLPPAYTPKALIENGYIRKAATLRELAVKSGIDPGGLAKTVERFNEFARTGRDLDFHRGDSAFDRSYGDPSVKPNPCLAPIAQSPFYSVNVYPGDLGTKGGLVTNEWAQVLREDGRVIDGLYAAGNTTASVMGNTYPGGGSTLGPAMTFGYLAAMHAAGRSR